jgi:hypothetical protein
MYGAWPESILQWAPASLSRPSEVVCRRAFVLPDNPGPSGLYHERGAACSLCIGRVGWLCYARCGAGAFTCVEVSFTSGSARGRRMLYSPAFFVLSPGPIA